MKILLIIPSVFMIASLIFSFVFYSKGHGIGKLEINEKHLLYGDIFFNVAVILGTIINCTLSDQFYFAFFVFACAVASLIIYSIVNYKAFKNIKSISDILLKYPDKKDIAHNFFFIFFAIRKQCASKKIFNRG